MQPRRGPNRAWGRHRKLIFSTHLDDLLSMYQTLVQWDFLRQGSVHQVLFAATQDNSIIGLLQLYPLNRFKSLANVVCIFTVHQAETGRAPRTALNRLRSEARRETYQHLSLSQLPWHQSPTVASSYRQSSSGVAHIYFTQKEKKVDLEQKGISESDR